ncbi:SDR family oxidoreductase [Pedobacter sp. Hv1]|uniref:SDR family oxidoreductase n=1 Tax=Pedobacter sp. Hv1 TaxID=1740090 RepID=UPI0006D89C2D|nr:SDR family oxidoreductase [Pedobacter sp. Hv1]KQC01361.1 hypothetical protein AQF98_06515 [Pedobacter sp. Hv1]
MAQFDGKVAIVTGGGNDELKEEFGSQIPLKRWGETKEVANSVVYLCPSKSSFITGHTLGVDRD